MSPTSYQAALPRIGVGVVLIVSCEPEYRFSLHYQNVSSFFPKISTTIFGRSYCERDPIVSRKPRILVFRYTTGSIPPFSKKFLGNFFDDRKDLGDVLIVSCEPKNVLDGQVMTLSYFQL